MNRSSHSWTPRDAAGAERYAHTPSGIRTIVAPYSEPHGGVVHLSNEEALQALDELARADETREEEEPTTEWTPTPPQNNLGAALNNVGALSADLGGAAQNNLGALSADHGSDRESLSQNEIDELIALELKSVRSGNATASTRPAAASPSATTNEDDNELSKFDVISDNWLLSEQTSAPIADADAAPSWHLDSGGPSPSGSRTWGSDWTKGTWMTVAAGVLGAEMVVLFLLTL